MIITLKDGSKKEYAEAKSVYDIALDISEGLARAGLCRRDQTARRLTFVRLWIPTAS